MRAQTYATHCFPVSSFTPRSDVTATSDDALAQLASASHDLRDPLQLIATYMDLLADGVYGPVNSSQRAYLMRVRGHVDHLAAVVGSALLLARAAHGGHSLAQCDIAVPPLFEEVHALVEPFAVAGDVSLVVDGAHAPAVVRGERTVLLRVLTNLVGNAVKFTPRGGRVSLSAVTLPNAVELRVADTGPGISSTQIDAIFEPFVQGHVTDELKHRGAGLGLSIARDLTRLMGAELLARSAVGVGSLFAVRFPAKREPAKRGGRVATAKAA